MLNRMSDRSQLGKRPEAVHVLAGGPDRERPISLLSGANIAQALAQVGYEVIESDIMPDRLDGLDEVQSNEVVFPALHGRWGEGGPLQAILEARGCSFVGCDSVAAALCMNKDHTKRALHEAGLPTADWMLPPAVPIDPPVVVKIIDEGSSFGIERCLDAASRDEAILHLSEQGQVMVERMIRGREVTVGLLDQAILNQDVPKNEYRSLGLAALPMIEVIPPGSEGDAWYDFDAKYQSDQTQYRFDVSIRPEIVNSIHNLAVQAGEVLGVRDLARVDFLVDQDDQPWILEVNTMPGFTGHSLLPMAANQAGLDLPGLVDRLVRHAYARMSD